MTEHPAAEHPSPVTPRKPLADAVITALDVYGSMGNGEGWTLDHDVIGTLWEALTPDEKARTGYDVAAMDAHVAEEHAKRGTTILDSLARPVEEERK